MFITSSHGLFSESGPGVFISIQQELSRSSGNSSCFPFLGFSTLFFLLLEYCYFHFSDRFYFLSNTSIVYIVSLLCFWKFLCCSFSTRFITGNYVSYSVSLFSCDFFKLWEFRIFFLAFLKTLLLHVSLFSSHHPSLLAHFKQHTNILQVVFIKKYSIFTFQLPSVTAYFVTVPPQQNFQSKLLSCSLCLLPGLPFIPQPIALKFWFR